MANHKDDPFIDLGPEWARIKRLGGGAHGYVVALPLPRSPCEHARTPQPLRVGRPPHVSGRHQTLCAVMVCWV
jgi:hypothetical protein